MAAIEETPKKSNCILLDRGYADGLWIMVQSIFSFIRYTTLLFCIAVLTAFYELLKLLYDKRNQKEIQSQQIIAFHLDRR